MTPGQRITKAVIPCVNVLTFNVNAALATHNLGPT